MLLLCGLLAGLAGPAANFAGRKAAHQISSPACVDHHFLLSSVSPVRIGVAVSKDEMSDHWPHISRRFVSGSSLCRCHRSCRAGVKSGTGDKAGRALTHSTGDSGRAGRCRRWINDTCIAERSPLTGDRTIASYWWERKLLGGGRGRAVGNLHREVEGSRSRGNADYCIATRIQAIG